MNSLFSDPHLLILDKPAGLSVIPERYDNGGPSLAEITQLYPVHRIDKETSGIVMFARSAEAQRQLSRLFEEHQVHKVYHALVNGVPEWQALDCDQPLMIDADRRHRTRVHPEGKSSHTGLQVLERFGGYALVAACPTTGRTHQIRAHLSWLGHPIVGDELYGGGEGLYLSRIKRGYRAHGLEKPLIARVALHAFEIGFEHPIVGSRVEVRSDYPEDLKLALKQLRRYAGR